MREIDTIIIHCSATEFGNTELFNEWHLAKGWDGIGYHFIICNAYPTRQSWVAKQPDFPSDGLLEIGRDIDKIGAHTLGHNQTSIGICLVGDRAFTGLQYTTLKNLVKTLRANYKINKISGHYEYQSAIDQGKTCPNIDMEWLRELLGN